MAPQSREFQGRGYSRVAEDERVDNAHAHAHGASDEEEDLSQAIGEDIDLPEDVYGATIFSIVHDSVELMTKVDHDQLAVWINRARVMFVITSLVFNYTLQLSLLVWSYVAVVAPAVKKVQRLYKEYHQECFEVDGTFSEVKWQEWDSGSHEELCGMVLSNFCFLYLMLCLWWMTMLNEFRKTDRIMRKFQAMIPTGKWDCQIETDGEGTQRVKRLVCEVRWFLYLFLILPKHVISVGLLVIGTWWLVATDSFENLILNALALGFVIEIDELIFEAMFPAVMGECLGQVKLWRMRSEDKKEIQQVAWQQYRRSGVYWVVILFGVYIYLAVLQGLPWLGVLPGYKNDLRCSGYLSQQLTMVCNNWAVFNGAECFPFGSSETDDLPPHPEVYAGG